MKIKRHIQEINRGGFGIIDKVELEDKTIVARKTFSPASDKTISRSDREKLRKRFIREVKTQEMLPSTLFIPIIYSHLEGDSPWFLMPCAEKDYSKEIQDARLKKRPPNGLSDILNSLEHLHKLELVHRDLKPQNILFSEGSWKLADLGLISQDKSILTTTITTTEAGALGTFLYAAPEQMHDFRSVRPAADIYSFGAILHDIFNGKPRTPFTHLSASGSIGYIIEKCTEEKPEKRFKNIASLRKVLLEILSNHKISSNQTVKEWAEKLDDIGSWNQELFEKLFYSLRNNELDIQTLFFVLDSEKIEALFKVDKHLWNDFVLLYFEWIEEKSFNFDYCDVLIGTINTVYELSNSIEIKANAILTASKLGASHNRWYVMSFVVKMCSSTIEESLAERIAIELHIKGENAKQNMHLCVSRINKAIDSYHSLVAAALKEEVD